MALLALEVGEREILTGSFSCLSGNTYRIFGALTGTLIVTSNSEVEVYGTINGELINNGGKLRVYGLVIGQIVTLSGETIISKNAKVHSASSYIV